MLVENERSSDTEFQNLYKALPVLVPLNSIRLPRRHGS
jgi:hypothetical protein